jgi:hypothetical protein
VTCRLAVRNQTKVLVSLFLFLLCESNAQAQGEWPQWRGPNRDGHSSETGLLKDWPKDGPPVLWKRTDIGGGYSTPSVSNGRVYFMSNRKASGGPKRALGANRPSGW